MPLAHAEQESLNNVHRGRDLVTRNARTAEEFRRERDHNSERRRALETRQPLLAQPDPHRATRYWMLAGAVVATYLLDLFVFSPVVEDLFGGILASSPGLLTAARLIIPALVVWVEMTIGVMRDTARDSVYGQPSVRAWLFTGLGLVIPLAMACIVYSTQTAAMEAEPGAGISWAMVARIAALTLFSVVLHLAVLLGGRDVLEAKTYVSGRFHHRHLRSRENSAQRSWHRVCGKTADVFVRYDGARQEHNRNFPHLHQEIGPFDAVTADVLNEIYRRQAASTNTPESPAPPVTGVPPGNLPPQAPPPPQGPRNPEDEVTL
jgi:hypothetical protein